MEHLLDNPIFNALSSQNEPFSNGSGAVKYFRTDIAPFAGLKENSAADLDVLYRISPAEAFFILFLVREPAVPDKWKIINKMNILQMVFGPQLPPPEAGGPLVPLQEQQVPDMIALTKMTNPGPFLSGTIRFGHYQGIFDGTRLVAMAGQRLHPRPYAEISAVCTHPDYVGRGLASLLIIAQIRRIMAGSEIPFLHVLKENSTAIKLYEKLGFSVRQELLGYAIKKQ